MQFVSLSSLPTWQTRYVPRLDRRTAMGFAGIGVEVRALWVHAADGWLRLDLPVYAFLNATEKQTSYEQNEMQPERAVLFIG
jgi:hypothetical protein